MGLVLIPDEPCCANGSQSFPTSMWGNMWVGKSMKSKKSFKIRDLLWKMAEREGFEPSIRF